MDNNDENSNSDELENINRGHIVTMIRDIVNNSNDRPTFGNIFTHLAMNLIERNMIREAENRSLEENNKVVVATEEQMESLGNYQRVTKEEVSEDNTCCICLASYKQGEGKRTLGCEHSFHKKCIDKWLMTSKTECPICRKNPFD